MKVKSISSFFQKAGSSTRESSEEVEIPSRLKKGGSSKKGKSKVKEETPVHIGGPGGSDDSDREDPLPKSRRKGKDQNGGKSGKSRKPLAISEDDDSDKEEPLPKSVRNRSSDAKKDKGDKKRKALVLSEAEEEDDFKPQKKSSKEKPALKMAKVEKPVEPKKKEKEMKPIDPTEFFSSAPVKREAKLGSAGNGKPTAATKSSSPVKNENENSSPSKAGKTPPKSRAHNGKEEDSPHRPRTSIAEPKKLKMETPTPEKIPKSKSSTKSPPKAKTVEESKVPSPRKSGGTFKVPTPVSKEKSKPRTSGSAQKRSAVVDDSDDDDEEDFNYKKKTGTAGKSKRDKATPAKEDEEETPKLTDAQKENYKKFLAKQSMVPKNLGSKEIPVGAPDCLKGLNFVISGVLDSLEREDCKALIEKYGGVVRTSISGKTTHLIIGDEAGVSKIKKAQQMKLPQINEDDLLDMIRKSNPNGNSQDSGLPYSEGMAEDSEQFKTEEEEDYDADKSLFATPAGSKRPSPSKTGLKESKLKEESKSPAKSPSKKAKMEEEDDVKPNKIPAPVNSLPQVPIELMWVDKYKPKTLKNVVGQGGETSNAKKLQRWLQNWFNYHGSSEDKVKASWPGLRDPEGKTFKAALLSGPPGIGKTTTAHLVIKEVGYDYFELNASDTRNKRGLHENVADALSSKTLAFGKINDEKARRHVLIMDEVDGMSGNEDRGGVQELIARIKSSRVPVICICNDRNHPKIRSLANYCFDLRFNKPSFEQLKAFIMSICFKEKIKLPHEKIQQLIISTDNDVRQILHQLELFKEGKSQQAFDPRKDLRFGPWDVIRKVFLKSEHAKMSIHDKNGLFFQDYNIGPLFVQENYPKWTPAAAGGNRYRHMDLIGKTAASLADGDMVENLIRRNQNWSLLPLQAAFSSYIPGEYMSSNQVGGVEFPQWLGKNSNKNKRHRLLQSLHSHLQLHVSGSLEALNMDYLPYFRRNLTKPLIAGDVESAAQVMESYTLLRDDVDSITDLSVWPGTKNPMENVDTRTKTAFTRLVNKEILPYSTAKPVKSKGRGGGNAEEDLETLMEEGEGSILEEEEEEESLEKDAMVKMKNKKAAGSSKAASSSSSKGRKGKKKDDYEDDEEDVKSSKSSKNKQPSKSRKGR